MVHVDLGWVVETAEVIAGIESVVEIYSCAGNVDLIAIIRVPSVDQIEEIVANGIARLPGVSRTITYLVYKCHLRTDISAGFSLGIAADT
ncbi:Lrp/AsnC family transcriptional regulator [Nocardia sp. CA-128927]|uniref:Lrp/AsnC family transcriptional regulator n=1 Tax=Nocardia sp. CA-128927 TaxID=3239975 RepID=UPI003D9976DD